MIQADYMEASFTCLEPLQANEHELAARKDRIACLGIKLN